MIYSRLSLYRPSQYRRPFQVPNRVFEVILPPISSVSNTAGFTPVPRTAVLGGTTVTELVACVKKVVVEIIDNDQLIIACIDGFYVMVDLQP